MIRYQDINILTNSRATVKKGKDIHQYHSHMTVLYSDQSITNTMKDVDISNSYVIIHSGIGIEDGGRGVAQIEYPASYLPIFPNEQKVSFLNNINILHRNKI